MISSKRPNPRQNAGATPGTYFLSLTVENIRCFGPPQTLDLSNGRGDHAPWTIILGENGLGKTTLLTCLAVIASSTHLEHTADGQHIHLSEWIGAARGLARSNNSGKARFYAEVSTPDKPSANAATNVKQALAALVLIGSIPSNEPGIR